MLLVFDVNYKAIVRNQIYFKDTHKYSDTELIYDYKGTNYIPVLNYLMNVPSNEEITNSYTKYAEFLQSSLNSKYHLADEIFVPLNNKDYTWADFKNNAMYYKVNIVVPTENYMEDQFKAYIESTGLSAESYFYEVILSQNQVVLVQVVQAVSLDLKPFDDYTEGEQVLLFQEFQNNFELY